MIWCKLNFLGGEIITNGYGIADIRRRSSALLDSKCSEILEICCRHPDWRDVPLETYVEIENPPAECEEDFYDNDDYNYEYEDSTCIKVKTCSFDFLKNVSKLVLVQYGIFNMKRY